MPSSHARARFNMMQSDGDSEHMLEHVEALIMLDM